MKKANEIIEGIGVVLILVAYGLISFGYLGAENVQYHLINLVGAGGLIYVTIKNKIWQPAAMNIIWFLIALIGIWRIFV